MRELLSGALPAPDDEPQQRDVIDAAMDWGSRRRRRDLAMTGAAALAVLAIGAGAVAMAGGSGNAVSAAGGPQPSATRGSVGLLPPGHVLGSVPSQTCSPPAGAKPNYCQLLKEMDDFGPDFATGSVPYIQADLPSGYTVKATGTWVVLLTGPDGKTNYLFPSTEDGSSLDGHMLQCATPKPPTCTQTSTEGGIAEVNGGPDNPPSAAFVKDGLKDPRVDLLVGVTANGAQQGLAAPTSATSMLTNDQLIKIVGDAKFLAYATNQLKHLQDVTRQVQAMSPPSQSGSGSYSGPWHSSASGATGSQSSGPDGSQSSGPGDPQSSPVDTRNSSPDGSQSSPTGGTTGTSPLNAGQAATGTSSSG
jgi:hypothetical protein